MQKLCLVLVMFPSWYFSQYNDNLSYGLKVFDTFFILFFFSEKLESIADYFFTFGFADYTSSKMKLIIEKNKIQAFEFTSEILVTCSKNMINVENFENNLLNYFSINDDVIAIYNYNSNILFQFSEEENVYLIDKNGFNIKLKNTLLLGKVIDNEFIYLDESNGSVSKFNKNLEKMQNFVFDSRPPSFICGDYFFRFLNSSFNCYDLNTKNIIWQKELK